LASVSPVSRGIRSVAGTATMWRPDVINGESALTAVTNGAFGSRCSKLAPLMMAWPDVDNNLQTGPAVVPSLIRPLGNSIAL
jgi:hypothetical protein